MLRGIRCRRVARGAGFVQRPPAPRELNIVRHAAAVARRGVRIRGRRERARTGRPSRSRRSMSDSELVVAQYPLPFFIDIENRAQLGARESRRSLSEQREQGRRARGRPPARVHVLRIRRRARRRRRRADDVQFVQRRRVEPPWNRRRGALRRDDDQCCALWHLLHVVCCQRVSMSSSMWRRLSVRHDVWGRAKQQEKCSVRANRCLAAALLGRVRLTKLDCHTQRR